MKFITIDDPKELPWAMTFTTYTEKWEVEQYHPDAVEVYVYSPTETCTYYYVPVSE